ncbi:MAG: lactate utilization protein [Clostridiales bacterium]|nr:lactate utilization protein [Clostridiales bacterium]
MSEYDLDSVAKALEKNGMRTFIASDRNAAARIAEGLIPKGASVASGGSVTLKECGIIDMLRSGDYRFFETRSDMPPREIAANYRAAYNADYYFSGSNAVTKDGVLYNVDGRGNRVSAIAFGPGNVVVVVGANKIVEDIDEAVKRVKSVAAPLNGKRLGIGLYCTSEGECVSLRRGGGTAERMHDGCASENRICVHYLVSAKQRVYGRITVILVDESLGF